MSADSPAPLAAVDEEKLASEVRSLVSQLLKAIKSIALYRHDPSRFRDFLARPYQSLFLFLERNESLTLKVEGAVLEYRGEPIHEDHSRENLFYPFFRDGIRYLTFRTGLSDDELLRFTLLLLDSQERANRGSDDTVTRLWKENFSGIEYIVVEGFQIDEIDQKEFEVEVDQVVNFLYRQLAGKGDDVIRSARLSFQDIALELEDIEQIRGAIITGQTAAEADKLRAQNEVERMGARRIPHLVALLFDFLAQPQARDHNAAIEEAFTQLLDAMLFGEVLGGIVDILDKFGHALREPVGDDHRETVRTMRHRFVQCMGEQPRLEQLRHLLEQPEADQEPIARYLEALPAESVYSLLDLLDGLNQSWARQRVRTALVKLGDQAVEAIIRRLGLASPTAAEDMLTVLATIDTPNLVDVYGRCVRHSDPAIRLAALQVITAFPRKDITAIIQAALEDDELPIRLHAYTLLRHLDPDNTTQQLLTLIEHPNFDELDPREQEAVFRALGAFNTLEGLQYLAKLFQGYGLLGRRRLEQRKMLAVVGLLGADSIPAYKLLAKQAKNLAHSGRVRRACREGAAQLRARLLKARQPRA